MKKMCDIKRWGPIFKGLILVGGYATEVAAIVNAAKNGDWLSVITGAIHLIVSILALSDNCFTGDTLVTTENGQKRIDEIEIGDKVWSFDIYTGETELKEVTTVFVHDCDQILHLHTTSDDIDTTTNHPFYVIGNGWVAAGDLAEGDELYLESGKSAFVTGSEIENLAEPIRVYNLEVADYNTYFVGDESVLVHNYDNKRPTNSKNEPYPSVTDPRTGEEIPFPQGDISKVPKDQRVEWDNYTRRDFIKEWYDRGFPKLDWSKYDIHHILPRAFGGTNAFDNLVPLLRETEHTLFTKWWAGF